MLKVFALIGMLAVHSSYNVASLDPDQLYCVAKAVYSEARGEPVMGQVAIAWGVKHRVESKDFPNTACGVIYDEKYAVQFPYIKKIEIDESSPEWDSAVETAVFSWLGIVDDPIGDRRFWYNPKKARKPNWLVMGSILKIGHHSFYDRKKSNADE